jgi:hypothetical protein
MSWLGQDLALFLYVMCSLPIDELCELFVMNFSHYFSLGSGMKSCLFDTRINFFIIGSF